MAFSQVAYDKANTSRVYIKLNNQTDADILAFLGTVDNKQGLIKQLLRDYMESATIYTLDEIRELVGPIAKAENLKKVILFGSYSRGEATGASDLDFCVTFPEDASLITRGRVTNALQDAFGKEIDIVTDQMLESTQYKEFANNIRKDGIVIYENKR